MGPGKIVGPGHERPGEDRGMKEPKSPGQRSGLQGRGPWMQSVDWDYMWNLKVIQVNLYMKQEKKNSQT